MKRYLLLLTMASGLAAAAQTESQYQAAVDRFRSFYNAGQADSIFAMFAPSMQASLPLDKTQSTVNSLQTQLGKLKGVTPMVAQGKGRSYKAAFDQATVKLMLVLDAQDKLSGLWVQPYTEPAQTMDTASNFDITAANGNRIWGTLTVPDAKQVMPLVLIIAGSGPTDRNCNSPQGLHTDAYRMLADSLKEHGIASLRYDKRGIGQSQDPTHPESEMRFDDMIADAVAIIKKLQQDQRFSGIYVLGHSEGALVGLEAAVQVPVAGYISLAGIAGPADKTIVRQLGEQSKEIAAKAAADFKELRMGKTVKNTDPMLESLFRSSVQPYLMSWIKYDPSADIKKIKVPVLIIQGTTDIQVTVDDAKALHAAAAKSKMVLIDGMNHILKTAAADREQNLGTYSNPALPLHPGLVSALRDFIHPSHK